MDAIVMLADYAAATDGKLTIVGGGWQHTVAAPHPHAVVVLFQVDWDETNRRHRAQLVLVNGDGEPVLDAIDNVVRVEFDLEVGRPAGVPGGASLNVPFAGNFGPLPFVPGNRYVWELTVDGSSKPAWQASFSVQHTLPGAQAA